MRPSPWILTVALACGPDKADDIGALSSSSGDPTTTGAAASTTPTTTGETSTTAGATTTAESSTTGATTTGEPSTATGETSTTTGEALPLTAFALATIYGRPSALEGIPGWPFDPAATCPNPPDAPCGTPPVLGEPTFLINGVVATPDSIALGDRVAVLFPYGDAACDVRCGFYSAFAEDDVEGTGGGGNPPSDLPCSTDDSNFWLALDFGEIERPGEHRGFARLEDTCGAMSEPRQISFVPLP
jgi:hypothetical protein